MAAVCRLLLVEFAASDRFHRAVLFPFVQGWARGAGLECRWLRYGVPAAAQADSAAGGVALAGAERAELADRVRGFGPDLILFQPAPDADVLQAVRRAAGRARLALLDDAAGGPPPVGVERLDPLRDRLDRALGREDAALAGSGLLARVSPDFGFEPANRAAARMQPLPFVFAGPECSYARPLSNNPFFAGIDPQGCIRPGGCAFCSRPAGPAGWPTPAAELLRRQLEALDRTLPPAPGGLCIRLVGEPAIAHLDAAVAAARRLQRRPLELLLDCRADRLLAARAGLEAVLAEMSGSGCRIELALIGIESFSSDALQRLNKGLSPATNLAAIAALFELERDHPAHFGFRAHGGLSLIGQTPWTRPTELALDLAVIRALGLEALAGKALSGRLRLVEGLALTAAARRDGLLRPGYEDARLDTARHNLYAAELPWRFAHAELEAVSQLLVRLAGPGGGPPDALEQRLDAVAATLGRGTDRRSLRGALAVLDCAVAAAAAGPPAAAEQLVDAAAERIEEEDRDALELERWLRHRDLGAGPAARSGGLELETLLQLKPVCKLEPVDPAERGVFEADGRLPNARSRLRRDRPQVAEVFCGLRAQDVAAALELAERQERAEQGSAFQQAVEQTGRLLGYPDCCAAAFAAAGPWASDNYFWLQLERRLAEPGAVSPLLNPLANPLLEYVPCGLGCRASLERAETLLDRLRQQQGGAAAAGLLQRLRHPALLLMEPQGCGVELIPDSEPGERFGYRAGLCVGSGPLLDALARGDELVVEPECISVLRAGRSLACLSARAYPWWSQRALQIDFWRAMLACHRALGEPGQPDAAAGRHRPADPGPELAALFERLERLRAGERRFAGLAIERLAAGAAALRVELAGRGQRLALDVAPLQPGAAVYLEAGAYGLTYPRDAPPAGAVQRAAARALAAELLRHGPSGP